MNTSMMKPIRSITAATDFSRDGTRSVQRATLLANALSARLELLHVVDASPLAQAAAMLAGKPGGRAACLESVRRKLDATVKALQVPELPSIRARLRVGSVLDEILHAAGTSDLLVLGARGQHPMRDAILGTTAERLLQKGHRAMLVVKKAPKRAYRNVVVPIDFSVDSIAALEATLRIAPAAFITLVHAYDVEFEGMLWRGSVPKSVVEGFRRDARTRALVKIHGVAVDLGIREGRFDNVVKRGYPPRVILDAARRKDADLIAIGKQGRSILERLLIGSVTRRVLGESRCDVLVARRRSS
jgi:nucleotide-binding universal stress UspA family protein